MEVNTPIFDKYVQHVLNFGDLFTIKSIWELIEWEKLKLDDTPYLLEQNEFWGTVAYDAADSLNREAGAELNQLFLIGNVVVNPELVEKIDSSLKLVQKGLSKKELLITVKEYNSKPERKLKKHEIDEDTWQATGHLFTLDETYVNYYLTEIVNDKRVLPAFETFCKRYLKSSDISKSTKSLVTNILSFDENVNKAKNVAIKDAIQHLVDKGYLVIEDGEYHWKGIGRSKVGSLAAVARYFEHAKLVRGFSTMNQAFEAYKSKFNLNSTDQNEWNKKYSPTGEIDFNSKPTLFHEELHCILKL